MLFPSTHGSQLPSHCITTRKPRPFSGACAEQGRCQSHSELIPWSSFNHIFISLVNLSHQFHLLSNLLELNLFCQENFFQHLQNPYNSKRLKKKWKAIELFFVFSFILFYFFKKKNLQNLKQNYFPSITFL